MTNPSRGELVPGGLAMVIGSYSGSSKNIGMIVRLKSMARPGDKYKGFTYVPRSGRPAWIVEGDGVASKRRDGSYQVCGFCFSLPENLIPINPEPDPLEITQHQEQSA